MTVKQLYPNFNQDVDPEYYHQAASSCPTGYVCECVDDDKVILRGEFLCASRECASGIKAISICKINHNLRGLHPLFIAYDSGVGGKPIDAFSLITKGICLMDYPLISDPVIKLGGNDFWDSYLARCSDDEISVLTLDPTHNTVIDSTPWTEITHFNQCNDPNKVIRVNWAYRDRARMYRFQ